MHPRIKLADARLVSSPDLLQFVPDGIWIPQPVGVLEEMLVEKIAVCYWRLRRVLRCEIGEIRKELDTASWKFVFKLADIQKPAGGSRLASEE